MSEETNQEETNQEETNQEETKKKETKKKQAPKVLKGGKFIVLRNLKMNGRYYQQGEVLSTKKDVLVAALLGRGVIKEDK